MTQSTILTLHLPSDLASRLELLRKQYGQGISHLTVFRNIQCNGELPIALRNAIKKTRIFKCTVGDPIVRSGTVIIRVYSNALIRAREEWKEVLIDNKIQKKSTKAKSTSRESTILREVPANISCHQPEKKDVQTAIPRSAEVERRTLDVNESIPQAQPSMDCPERLLGEYDLGTYWPHITVAHKIPHAASVLEQVAVKLGKKRLEGRATGVDVWLLQNDGSWQHQETINFAV